MDLMVRKITIEEAVRELKKRLSATTADLDSPEWCGRNGRVYSYTLGRQDTLDEVLVLLETDYV